MENENSQGCLFDSQVSYLWPWGMEIPFITIRSIGEGYKNWTVGMWQKGGRESPICDGFRPVTCN